jgi:hypothetical protein
MGAPSRFREKVATAKSILLRVVTEHVSERRNATNRDTVALRERFAALAVSRRNQKQKSNA